jgi:hypothetical protein
LPREGKLNRKPLSAAQTSRNIKSGKEKVNEYKLGSDLHRKFGIVRGDLCARHHRMEPVVKGVSPIYRGSVRPLRGVPSGIDSRIDGVFGGDADRCADAGICNSGIRVVPSGLQGKIGSFQAVRRQIFMAPLFSGAGLSHFSREPRQPASK